MNGQRALLFGLALSLGFTLGGCESFEGMDSWFSTKRPLPGDRKPVFADGVPGVPQGVPPELVKGYQPPPEPPPVVAEQPKAKPAPRPRRVASPKQAPTQVTVQPTATRPPARAAVQRPPVDNAFPPPPPPARAQTNSPFPPPSPQPSATPPQQTASPFPPPPPPPAQ